MSELLAKSEDNGGTTLRDHTAHVIMAIDVIAREWLSEDKWQTARHGALLHDLGKAHPYFQDVVYKRPLRDDVETVPHRHELSSLLFLPLFPREEWKVLVDLVVAHHKSIRRMDERGTERGILDLVENYGDRVVFERHAEDFLIWQTGIAPIVEEFGITYRPIPLEEARDAWDFAVEYCESKTLGRSEWRGVLMSADHLASALEDGTQERITSLFTRPDLAIFDSRAKNIDGSLFPLAKYSVDDSRPHTLVVAPTGSGKTDYLLRRCRIGRVFYLLPFQASINAMYERLKHLLDKDGVLCDIRRVHSASRIELESGIAEEQILQKHPGASVKVMTPHQLASIVLGTSGHETAMLDVRGQDVILDEIHVYGEQSQAMTLAIVETLIALGAQVHIGSATIPAALKDELIRRMGGEEAVYTVRLNPEELKTYNRHIVHKLADEAAARAIVLAALKNNQRVLFLSNRVADAQARYAWAKEVLDDSVPVLLLHSRYRRMDRAKYESKIGEFDKKEGPCLVCATQVVEVSLDISFDTLITNCAPLDALIQRFGRVNRRRLRNNLLKLAPVYVIAPPDGASAAKPYELGELKRTWSQLPDGETLDETTLQERIDAVYSRVDITPISVHLAVDNTGNMLIDELHHRSRSVLVDMLEIDSACCIRASDVTAYTESRGDTRQLLEIPVPWKSIAKYTKAWRPLKGVGHDPFIVPDAIYSETCGLWLQDDSAGRPDDLIHSQFC